MLDPDLDRLLQEALRLRPEERAALAGSLLDSLDSEVDDDAEHLWRLEIQRRLRALDDGTAKTVPWSEARRRIIVC